eukprot:g3983.t1
MSGGSGGDGVTCELLERLLDDLVVEDEIEMDSGLKLAFLKSYFSRIGSVTPGLSNVQRIDIAKHLLVEDHGTNTFTTCGDEEDVRPIRTMLNEINTIEASRTNANLIQCQFVTYKKTTTTRTKKKKSRVIIPNVENILGPL